MATAGATHGPPTRRLPRAERREQILSAAASAFVRTGYDGTSMDDVARAAGVTRLIVYRIFATKFDLYTAVLTEMTDAIVAAFDPLPPRGEFPHAVLAVARRRPDAFRLLWRHAANEPDFVAFAITFRSVTYEFTEGLLAADVSDPGLRPWAARSIVGYLYESVCLWLDDGTPARDDDVAHALAVGINAMAHAWATSTVGGEPASGADGPVHLREQQ